MDDPAFISRALLVELFPPIVIDGTAIRGVAPEVGSYRRDMGGKSWVGVDPAMYERHTDALTLMDAGSLRHFVAGYLAVAMDDPHTHSATLLGYHACNGSRLRELCRHLTPMQSSCVYDIVDYTLSIRQGPDDRELDTVRRNRLRTLFPPHPELRDASEEGR